jgi:hypothetical protein
MLGVPLSAGLIIKCETKIWMTTLTGKGLFTSYLKQETTRIVEKVGNVCAGCIYRSFNIGCQVRDSCNEY